MEKRAFRLLAAPFLLAAAASCHPRGTGGAGGPKYPRRAPNCDLAIFNEPVPTGVAGWDDLGVAEVACHINTAYPQCFDRLRTEACRMGGDIIYNIPKKPFRPRDEVVVLRGQVAHTRGKSEAQMQKEADEKAKDLPPPATHEEAAGPVQPLVAPAPDAGAAAQ